MDVSRGRRKVAIRSGPSLEASLRLPWHRATGCPKGPLKNSGPIKMAIALQTVLYVFFLNGYNQ